MAADQAGYSLTWSDRPRPPATSADKWARGREVSIGHRRPTQDVLFCWDEHPRGALAAPALRGYEARRSLRLRGGGCRDGEERGAACSSRVPCSGLVTCIRHPRGEGRVRGLGVLLRGRRSRGARAGRVARSRATRVPRRARACADGGSPSSLTTTRGTGRRGGESGSPSPVPSRAWS
jgi:hypothetical protein